MNDNERIVRIILGVGDAPFKDDPLMFAKVLDVAPIADEILVALKIAGWTPPGTEEQ